MREEWHGGEEGEVGGDDRRDGVAGVRLLGTGDGGDGAGQERVEREEGNALAHLARVVEPVAVEGDVDVVGGVPAGPAIERGHAGQEPVRALGFVEGEAEQDT